MSNEFFSLIQSANKHIEAVRKLIAQDRIAWKLDELPLPDRLSAAEKQAIRNASRAFSGVSPGSDFTVNVVQASTERGIVHMGGIISSEAPHITVLPPAVANEFYHHAASSHN